MSDVTQDPTSGRSREAWRAEAHPDPDRDYGGGAGGQEDPPVDPDIDMPGDPPPPHAEQEYGGGSGGEETPRPKPDSDMPGDPPPPEVAEKNGR